MHMLLGVCTAWHAHGHMVQDAEYKQLWGRVQPGQTHLELLEETQEVCVPARDKNGGLYPVDVLDPSLYVPLHVVYYYHNLIWFLKKQKYEPGKTLFGLGYDFRQSNFAHLDALQARLEEASKAANGAKCAPFCVHCHTCVLQSALAHCRSQHEPLAPHSNMFNTGL
jgi:hypothetical protein